jgi:hypothetical protein
VVRSYDKVVTAKYWKVLALDWCITTFGCLCESAYNQGDFSASLAAESPLSHSQVHSRYLYSALTVFLKPSDAYSILSPISG